MQRRKLNWFAFRLTVVSEIFWLPSCDVVFVRLDAENRFPTRVSGFTTDSIAEGRVVGQLVVLCRYRVLLRIVVPVACYF